MKQPWPLQKSESVIDQRLLRCFAADVAAKQAIDLYDNFAYLYRALTHQLNVFDTRGNLRDPEQAKGDMTAALELMTSLNHSGITKAVASIQRALPGLAME